MILDRAILRSSSSSIQRLMKCHYPAAAAAAVISSSTSSLIVGHSGGHEKRCYQYYFSTDLRRSNDDNMIQQEWTTYHDKIPVLQSVEVDASHDTTSMASSASTTNPVNNVNTLGHVGHVGNIGITNMNEEKPRVSVLMELHDRVGVLHDVLKYFWKYDINATRIESRPVQNSGPFNTKPKFGMKNLHLAALFFAYGFSSLLSLTLSFACSLSLPHSLSPSLSRFLYGF